jgi:uncharacterized protein (TIGR03000 family)
LIGLLSLFAVTLVAHPAQAQGRFSRGRVVARPVYPRSRMPGWDWWRTYPWSPYNYGRNPYNPAWYGYPYPAYGAYGYPAVPEDAVMRARYDAATLGGAETAQQVLVPEPSGRVTSPPAGAAAIRLYIPDEYGTVAFDGAKTESIGTTRYYVTPELPGDRPLTYDVTAQFKRNGQEVSEERKVSVSPGQTTVIDFRQAKPARTARE